MNSPHFKTPDICRAFEGISLCLGINMKTSIVLQLSMLNCTWVFGLFQSTKSSCRLLMALAEQLSLRHMIPHCTSSAMQRLDTACFFITDWKPKFPSTTEWINRGIFVQWNSILQQKGQTTATHGKGRAHRLMLDRHRGHESMLSEFISMKLRTS